MSSQDIKPREEHDWLCLAESLGRIAEPRYCQRCTLIERVREDERERLKPPAEDTWTCGDCGNSYDAEVRYCPNGRAEYHAVILASQHRKYVKVSEVDA